MNGLLLVVIGTIVFCTYRGYKKGLVPMVLALATWGISIAFTGFLGPVVAERLCQSEIVLEYVSEQVNDNLKIEECLYQSVEQTVGRVSIEGKTKLNKQQQEATIASLSLPKLVTDTIVGEVAVAATKSGRIAAKRLSKYVCDALAKLVINGITYMVIFFVAQIALRMLVKVFELVDELPGVGDVSELTGAVAGLTLGVLAVWVMFIFLLAISGTELGNWCYACVKDNELLAYIYNHNLLLDWIIASLNK